MTLLSTLVRPLLSYWCRRAAPRLEGTLFLQGLEKKVIVSWDPYAVPYVTAATERDLFMAQGYLHAQERLWQMDFTRRFHSGRLAEILGERPVPWQEITIRLKDKTTVDLDYFVRLMGIRRTACASLEILPREILATLEAYSEGVNRYIESHLKSLPVEFRLLRYQPDPWLPEDCLTIGKGFALLLSTALFTRLTADAIAARLKGQEGKVRSLLPRYPEWGPDVTRYVENGAGQDSEPLLRFINGTFYNSLWAAAGQGSNNWVLASHRSTNGGPMLCNDPHLRMTLPSVWYLVGLEAPPPAPDRDGYTVRGASIPGSPYIHLGHNRNIAWGVTAALCDDVDVYREKVHPEDPDRYQAGDRWERMERIEERIRVRGGREVVKTLRLTRHGPVIGDFSGSQNRHETLALRWTALDKSEDLRAVDGVNRARNWEDFLTSLSHQNAPTLNYLYADRDGNIGYSLAGRVPLRAGTPSLLPLPGWSGDFEWKGFVPFDELPRLHNPPEGVIATANNAVADSSYPHYLSVLFEPPYRIQRIRDLLSAKEKFSADDMAAIQADDLSLQALKTLDSLRNDLLEIARTEESLADTLQKLLQWDGRCHPDSAEAALYHVFYSNLMKNLLGDELGEELLLAYQELFNQAVAPTDQILEDPNSPWFQARPRLSLVRASLHAAWSELESRLGNDPSQWRWGDLHTLTLDHPLGRVGILASFFSLGPFPAPGDWATVNSGFYRHSFPYEQVVGSSLRMVLTPKSWPQSRIVLPSGQSGSPVSPHYRDQMGLWQGGKAMPMNYPAENSGQRRTLFLCPSPSE